MPAKKNLKAEVVPKKVIPKKVLPPPSEIDEDSSVDEVDDLSLFSEEEEDQEPSPVVRRPVKSEVKPKRGVVEVPTSPTPRARGRPKTKETYDVAAYSKKFRESAPPYHCKPCNTTVSYFSKLRHLQTLKHKANTE